MTRESHRFRKASRFGDVKAFRQQVGGVVSSRNV